MSSAGHILDSINRMNSNRSLRTKRPYFDVITSKRIKPKYPTQLKVYSYVKASPDYRRELQAKMSRARRIEDLKKVVIFSISMLIVLLSLLVI